MKFLAPLAVTLLLVAACAGTGEADGVSAEVAETWPEKWCEDAQPGMTRDELVAIMGEPTEEAGDESSSWYAFQWGFSAFYGSDGNARQLDWNGTSLSGADRARLTCEETRRL